MKQEVSCSLNKAYILIYIIHLAILQTFMFANGSKQSSIADTESTLLDKSSKDSKTNEKLAQGASAYLQGDIDILSQNAPTIVQELSSIIYEKTGVKVFLHVVKNTPQNDTQTDINAKFQNRRSYETHITEQIQGNYAIIFLFYNDHAITLKSNLPFLNDTHAAELLEDYAYPYLPADSVGTLRYNDGVNEGVSNLYLALTHKIAKHYNFELNAPKPMEKQSDVTKVVIYAMLLILIGLFILVRFGLLAFKKKG